MDPDDSSITLAKGALPPSLHPDDASRVRGRVLRHLLAHPSTIVPLLGGVTAAAWGWVTGDATSALTLLGLGGVALSSGVLATRWLFNVDELTEQTCRELADERAEQREEELDDLYRALKKDGDPRTEALLGRLRKSVRQITKSGLSPSIDPASRVDIAYRVAELSEQCVEALKAALDFRRRHRHLRGEARELNEERRDHEIAEVQACVETLERLSVDGGAAESTTPSSNRLQAMRDELHQSLEVARRVGERMKSLESGTSLERDR